jgi:hypothetical protein
MQVFFKNNNISKTGTGGKEKDARYREIQGKQLGYFPITSHIKR